MTLYPLLVSPCEQPTSKLYGALYIATFLLIMLPIYVKSTVSERQLFRRKFELIPEGNLSRPNDNVLHL